MGKEANVRATNEDKSKDKTGRGTIVAGPDAHANESKGSAPSGGKAASKGAPSDRQDKRS